MEIVMYRDTASRYGLCEDDGIQENMVEIDVPTPLLEGYYKDIVKISNPEYEDTDFDEWIHWFCDCDEMDGLLDYVKDLTGNLVCVKGDKND